MVVGVVVEVVSGERRMVVDVEIDNGVVETRIQSVITNQLSNCNDGYQK